MENRLEALCASQGVFTRMDALAEGYRDRSIRAMLKRGLWHRVRHGAYVPTTLWEQLDEVGRYRRLCRAVVLNAKCKVALSHVSALVEFGTPFWDLPLNEVHVTRFDGRAGRREAGVVQHHGTSYVGDLTIRNGLLITSGTRTGLDVSAMTDMERALVVLDGLAHQGETSVEALRQRNATMELWPDTLKNELLIEQVDPRSQSVGETRVRRICKIYGLPTPVPQYEITRGGILIAELDLAWPEHKVWLEFDGKVKYEKPWRREGDSATDVVWREKKREDRVRRLTGWICVRVTWADLYEPARLVAKIRQAFADQVAA
jgi:hypothetical protein